MHLRNLHIEHFRNLATQTVTFTPGFNYLYGLNGAGKTAVLEAVHLLARGRSFRTSKTASLITHTQDNVMVRGEIDEIDGPGVSMGVRKNRSGLTQMRLNGQSQSRASVLAQHLPIQTLLPQASELVLGPPSERRLFLDWGVFHVEQGFVETARHYRRVLAQRNAWLKTLQGRDPGVEADPWFAQLLRHGGGVNRLRADYMQRFHPLFERALTQLSPKLSVHVDYDWGGLVSVEQIEKKLVETWPRDVKFGVTHRGPHRADLRFSYRDQPASDVVSRGQAKMIAIAALLAQAELLQNHTGKKMLVMIDDFGAELDFGHWRTFLETLLRLNCQVIATSTERLDFEQAWVKALPELQMFHVKQGVLGPENHE